jgi:hypothetical protein
MLDSTQADGMIIDCIEIGDFDGATELIDEAVCLSHADKELLLERVRTARQQALI